VDLLVVNPTRVPFRRGVAEGIYTDRSLLSLTTVSLVLSSRFERRYMLHLVYPELLTTIRM
jgi:hypothetical protein